MIDFEATWFGKMISVGVFLMFIGWGLSMTISSYKAFNDASISPSKFLSNIATIVILAVVVFTFLYAFNAHFTSNA